MLHIAHYSLHSPLMLAPMAGLTDYPFRQLCRQLGAGSATSEMLSSDIDLWDSPKSRSRLPQANEIRPRIIQIAGNDPQAMATAAKAIEDKGADIIDINMGCPAKKVCKKAAGSALLSNTSLVNEILAAVTHQVSIPVTLKIRTGYSESARNAIKIAHIAEKNNIAALCVHGRHKEQKFTGHAEYETIRSIKANSNLPIIANGDIHTIDDISFILEYTQADGLMLGRTVLGQPWRFAELNHFMQTQQIHPGFSLNEKITIILKHIKHIHTYYNDAQGGRRGILLARSHIAHYLDKLMTSDFRHYSHYEQRMMNNYRQQALKAETQYSQVSALEEAISFSPNLTQVA